MLSGRPYSSARDAVRQSGAIVARMSVPDLRERSPAIRASASGRRWRPEGPLGRSGPGRSSRACRAADAETAAALAESNVEYERRFGHIYLVCASGRTGPQLLALLRGRLRNSPETEWQVVRTELQKINEIRLRKMLAGTP